MRRIAILNKKTAHRAQKLGSFGEALAARILQSAGFRNLRNLNEARENFPFGDIYAERGEHKYVISVKIRNRYEARTGRLNARYKLGKYCYELAARAQAELSATPAFLAISLASDSYSAYFAPLSVLDGSRGITMTDAGLLRYECLADDTPHGIDASAFKNTYSETPFSSSTNDDLTKRCSQPLPGAGNSTWQLQGSKSQHSSPPKRWLSLFSLGP